MNKAKAKAKSLEAQIAQLQSRTEDFELTPKNNPLLNGTLSLESRYNTPFPDTFRDPKWPNAPVLTDSKDPTFDFWSMRIL